MNAAAPVRAPDGAYAWSSLRGWLYDPDGPSDAVEGDVILTVSSDGLLRGVLPTDRAPLSAVLRVEGDVVEVVQRLDDLADRAAGLDTGLAVEVAALKHRVRRLETT